MSFFTCFLCLSKILSSFYICVFIQYWMLSKNNEIRRDDGCLDYSGGDNVIIYPCHGQHGNQEWQYREVDIQRIDSCSKDLREGGQLKSFLFLLFTMFRPIQSLIFKDVIFSFYKERNFLSCNAKKKHCVNNKNKNGFYSPSLILLKIIDCIGYCHTTSFINSFIIRLIGSNSN